MYCSLVLPQSMSVTCVRFYPLLWQLSLSPNIKGNMQFDIVLYQETKINKMSDVLQN